MSFHPFEEHHLESSKTSSTEQNGDQQTPTLESGYISAALAAAEKASEMFNQGMWETRCDSIRQSFQKVEKPILFNNDAPISSSDIELSSIVHEVDELVKLLSAFCPDSEKSTQSVKKQSQEIQRRLRLIIQKCRTQ
jgi:hypothetical protein